MFYVRRGFCSQYFFCINGLFSCFSFNFLIKEVVHPSPVCFYVCALLELFSSGICLLVLLILWLDGVCCNIFALSDCLSIDRNILLIVDVVLKRALYMLDFRIAEEFEEFSITGSRFMSTSLSFIKFY